MELKRAEWFARRNNARHLRSRPYSESYREHRDFLCRGAAVFAAFGSAYSTATDSCSHPPFAFNATSGTDVPNSRRDFSGNAAAVCVSGCVWRSDNCHTCVRSNSVRIAQLWFGQAGGMGFQQFWNPGPARSDHVCHDLQCTGDNGTGLLDSRFLGSTIIGRALCDLCSSWSPLATLSRCNVAVSIALVLEFLERAFRKEIHRCRQRDHGQSERCVNERRADGCNIDKNGDEVFPRHFLVRLLELGFVMMTRDRCAQQKKRNGARRGDGGIKRDRKWQRVIVAEINRYPRDERDPKKQIDVCPKNERIDPGDEVNKVMMIDPVDGDDDEAKDIGKKNRPHFRQGSWGRIMRGLQLQDHDGNENGDDAITERFEPVRSHAPECNMGEPAQSKSSFRDWAG